MEHQDSLRCANVIMCIYVSDIRIYGIFNPPSRQDSQMENMTGKIRSGEDWKHIKESRALSRLSASDPYPKVLYDPDSTIQEPGWLIGIHDSKVKPSQ